jgi:ABC-2 type transport system permease protein
VNLLNLPILFTSNALYPPGVGPEWLHQIAAYNPVSLCVNVLRENLFGSGSYYAYSPEIYFFGLLAWAVAFIVLAFVLGRRALRTP